MTVPVDATSAEFGTPLYVDSIGNFVEASADTASTMPCRALALEVGLGSNKVLMRGQICKTSWNCQEKGRQT